MTHPKGKIIVFGILFWYPLAGVTYQFLHYLIGLRRLGYAPFYLEDSARWIYDPRLNDLSPDASWNIETVLPALQAHGFGDHWGFRGKYPGGKCYGLSEAQIEVASVEGPPSGQSSTVTYVYRLAPAPRAPQTDPFYKLRGIFRGMYDDAGGGEAWLRRERENFGGPNSE